MADKSDSAPKKNWSDIMKNFKNENDDVKPNNNQTREGKKKPNEKKGPNNTNNINSNSNNTKKRNENNDTAQNPNRKNNTNPNNARDQNTRPAQTINHSTNSTSQVQTGPVKKTAQPQGGFQPQNKYLSSNSPAFMPQNPSENSTPAPSKANHVPSERNGHPPTTSGAKTPAATETTQAEKLQQKTTPTTSSTTAPAPAPEQPTPAANATGHSALPSVLKAKEPKRTQSAPLSDQPNKAPLSIPAKSTKMAYPQYPAYPQIYYQQYPAYPQYGGYQYANYPPYMMPQHQNPKPNSPAAAGPGPASTVTQPKKKSVLAIIDPDSKQEIKVKPQEQDKQTPSFLTVETPNQAEKKKKEEEEKKRKEEEEKKKKEEEEKKKKEEEEKKRKEEEEKKKKEEEEKKKKEEEDRKKKEEEDKKKREDEERRKREERKEDTSSTKKQKTEFVKYPKGIWTPLDPNGSKSYPLDFLLNFEDFDHCKTKPDQLQMPKAHNASSRQSISKSFKNRKQQNKPKRKRPDVPNQAENPWRPNKYPVNEFDMKTRAIRTILNKMSPSNEQELFNKIKTMDLDNIETMNNLIELLFDKAVREHKYCKMYAAFCVRIFHLGIEFGRDPTNESVQINFKRLLLKKCQNRFEDFFVHKTPIKFSDLLSEEEKEFKLKQMKFGVVIFMGELFAAKLLGSQVIHICIELLLGSEASNVDPGNESIEAACILLTSVGKTLDAPTAANKMTDYFNRFEEIIKTNIPLRIKFTIQNLIDLRKNKWVDNRYASQMKKQVELENEKGSEESKTQDARQQEPEKTKEVSLPSNIESAFKENLEEFFNSFEIEDLKEDLEELNASQYHADFVYLALKEATRNSMFADAIKKKFLPEFVTDSLISRDDFKKGFDHALKSIGENNLFFEIAGAAVLDMILPISHVASWGDANLINTFKGAAAFKNFHALSGAILKQKWEIPKSIKFAQGLELLSLEETNGKKVEQIIQKGDPNELLNWKSKMPNDLAVEYFILNTLLEQGSKEKNFESFVKPFIKALQVDQHGQLSFLSYISKSASKLSFADKNAIPAFIKLLHQEGLVKTPALLSWKKKEADNPLLKDLEDFFKNLTN